MQWHKSEQWIQGSPAITTSSLWDGLVLDEPDVHAREVSSVTSLLASSRFLKIPVNCVITKYSLVLKRIADGRRVLLGYEAIRVFAYQPRAFVLSCQEMKCLVLCQISVCLLTKLSIPLMWLLSSLDWIEGHLHCSANITNSLLNVPRVRVHEFYTNSILRVDYTKRVGINVLVYRGKSLYLLDLLG